MKNRWKKLAAVFGAAVLVICQNGVMEVKAEEPLNPEAIVLQEEISDVDVENVEAKDVEADAQSLENETAVVEEAETIALAENSMARQLSGATDLKWEHDAHKGAASFVIPNEKGEATYKVDIWRNGVGEPENYYRPYAQSAFGDEEKGAKVYLHLYDMIKDSGTYVFQITTLDMDGNPVSQAYSEPWEYVMAAEPLLTPQNISWNRDGVFSCEVPNADRVCELRFLVSSPDGHRVSFQLPSKVDEVTTFNLSEYYESTYHVLPGDGYYLQVWAVTADMERYLDSAPSAPVMFGNEPFSTSDDQQDKEESNSSSESNSEEAEVVVEEWKPATPDESKRYEAYGRNETINANVVQGDYSVQVINAMQGKLCYDSFEAVLEDYTIGRTYNIYPDGKRDQKKDAKARITLEIPKALQASGREYKMICVTAKGLPVVLKDLDTDPEKITFETDTYYAFALVYKDATAAK